MRAFAVTVAAVLLTLTPPSLAVAAVQVAGDFNSDGRADLAIGAPDDSVEGQNVAGAVNVIYGSRDAGLRHHNSQQFTQATPGVPGAVEPGDRFGSSLAAGDLDGDGFADLAIGAPTEGIRGRVHAGMVVVLYGAGSGLSTTRAQAWHQGSSGIKGRLQSRDRFGVAVTIGDFDGDGLADLAAGAPGDRVGGGEAAGAVNVIYGRRGGLSGNRDHLRTQDTRGIKGRAEAHDRFGSSLASADLSGDQRAELAVGAPGEGLGRRAEAGAVNVMYGRSHGVSGVDQIWHQASRGIRGAAEAGDRFAHAVAAADFDRDGVGDLAAGAPGEGLGARDGAGAVGVIYGTRSGLRARGDQMWHQASDGIAGTPEVDDRFGEGLSAADFSTNGAADLAVGAPGEGLGGLTNAGAVHVLYGSRGAGLGERADQMWHQERDDVLGQGGAGDLLGATVLAGDFDGDGTFDLAAGAPGDTVGGHSSAGAVNVLYGSVAGLTASRAQVWTQDTPGIEGTAGPDRFGAALAGGEAG